MPDNDLCVQWATTLSAFERGTFNVRETSPSCLLVGTLRIGGDLVGEMGVLCTIEPGPRWQQQIPTFSCHEKWMRRGDPDWHAYSDSSLCLEVSSRWRDEVGKVAQTYSEVETLRFAAEYLLNSAAWLISHHRYAFENGITKWPKSWPYWAHGDRGEHEYRQQSHVPAP